MARKRSQKDAWIPPYVNRGRSSWEYRPAKGVYIRLCGLESSKSVVLRRYAEEYDRHNTKKGTVTALTSLFLDSPQFKTLSPTTQKDYLKYWKQIEPVFGKMDAKKVTAVHIRKYMDLKGKKSQTQANRHKSFMSKVFSWGFERGHVETNPCKGVVSFSEKHREVYIEDHEYKAVYDHAPERVRIAMEISYLCAARQGDVIKLTKQQIKEEGIFIKQGKTGKKQIKAWSPRLRSVIERAKQLETNIETFYIIPTKSGTAYTSDGFRTMWTKAIKKAREETGLPLKFTFHDIKAKSISDYDGDKQKFSGHKTSRQVSTYDRKTEVVETLK